MGFFDKINYSMIVNALIGGKV